MTPQRQLLIVTLLACCALQSPATAQTRTWMDAAGAGPTGQPTTGNTVISMDPGSSQDIEVWLVDGDPRGTLLASYQLIFQSIAQPQAGATGTISYVDNNPGMGGGDSIFIDTQRPDWPYANSIAITVPVYNEAPSTNIFGVIYNTAIPLDDIDLFPLLSEGGYLAEFTIEASADACGTHLYAWNIIANGGDPPLAALFAPGGSQWMGGDQPTEFQNLEIRIGPPNDACAQAIELSGTNINEPFDTSCATVDGPQDCATGGDIWYRYTLGCTNLNGLVIGVTNGNVAVYQDGDCVTPGGGDCNPGPIAAIEGTTFLIQVIGNGGSGVLFIEGGGCASDADCDDNNPCTTDTCLPECNACSNTPNTQPCEDGDPCTLGDTCSGGTCVPGPQDSCHDFNPCTVDECVPGVGCENTDINGAPCTVDADCNVGSVDGADCEDGACVCTSGMSDALCLELRGPKADAFTTPCPVDGDDDNCAAGDHCIDGFCVSQACFLPGGDVVVDVELFPTPDDTACGGQFFLEYDTACLTLADIETDPESELGWDFVMLQQVQDGRIDLALAIPPALQCCVDPGNPLCRGTRTGGTIARLTFTAGDAEGDCTCGGVDFRVHNPPSGVAGPKGPVGIGGCNDDDDFSGTDSMRIQPDTFIVGGPDDDDIDTAADCGTFTKTLIYPPLTVEDPCVDGTAEPECTIEYHPACDDGLDCGMGDLCNIDDQCADGPCIPNDAAQEIGFTGFCALGNCIDGVCDNGIVPPGIELDDYLDCSGGCAFLPGETTLSCSYTNSCGNTEVRHITIDNSGLNKLLVDVELSPNMVDGTATDPITRCIDLSLSACDAATFFMCSPGSPTPNDLCFPQDMNACGGFPELCVATQADSFDVSVNVVFGAPDNIPGHGTACVEVPPANYDCLEAIDPKHSLSSTCTVECNEDGVLYAEFKGSKDTHPTCHWLVQGNLDGNPNIDIFDYTIVAGEYLTHYMSNDTPCKDPGNPPDGNNFNADFNGDTIVTLADWSFVVFNFFCAAKDPCSVICDPAPSINPAGGKRSTPLSQVSVRELHAAGLGAYADAADVNNDGMVNLTDMALFFESADEEDGDIAALRHHVKQLERSHREREILPRAKRTR